MTKDKRPHRSELNKVLPIEWEILRCVETNCFLLGTRELNGTVYLTRIRVQDLPQAFFDFIENESERQWAEGAKSGINAPLVPKTQAH